MKGRGHREINRIQSFLSGLLGPPPKGRGQAVGLCQDQRGHAAGALLQERTQRGRGVSGGKVKQSTHRNITRVFLFQNQ